MESNQIRTLFSRKHDTVFPKLGVFLGGPTPPSKEMENTWRRVIIKRLIEEKRLNPSMIVVAPEPESGNWADINNFSPKNELEVVGNKQMMWELQYLNLCDITAFWFPTYWTKETSGDFAPNIGPTSRFEFGYFLQEYLKNPQKKSFIVGSPEDAESIKWAKKITEIHGIKWHYLKNENKSDLVAQSFIDEIIETLIANKWNY
jgi:hypothetical protein